jgi:hypothetical protein
MIYHWKATEIAQLFRFDIFQKLYSFKVISNILINVFAYFPSFYSILVVVIISFIRMTHRIYR